MKKIVLEKRKPKPSSKLVNLMTNTNLKMAQ